MVAAEVRALRLAGCIVDLISVSNDDMARERFSKLRGALTVASGRGISPLERMPAEPDVIHVHNLFPYFGRDWIRDTDVPIIATQHSYRPMCANGYLFRDGHVCTLCPDGRRWSGVRHGCYRGSRLATVPIAVGNRRGAGADPLLLAAREILVLSDRSWDVFAAAGVVVDKLRRDWHFVPEDLADTEGRVDPPGRHWLYVGRLGVEKGIHRLIGAWPDGQELVVVGGGPERAELEQMARGKAISFRGQLGRPEVIDAMRDACGLIVPSLWYETFGLVRIEALAVGLPTLALPPNVTVDAVRSEGTGMVGRWEELESDLAAAAEAFPGLRPRCLEVFAATYSEAAFVERRIARYRALAGAALGLPVPSSEP